MSSLKRQSYREGISTPSSTAAARRYAAPSGGPCTKSLRSFMHGNQSSPIRSHSKYELRSISFEGSKVLPWTTRLVHSVIFKYNVFLNVISLRLNAKIMKLYKLEFEYPKIFPKCLKSNILHQLTNLL